MNEDIKLLSVPNILLLKYCKLSFELLSLKVHMQFTNRIVNKASDWLLSLMP